MQKIERWSPSITLLRTDARGYLFELHHSAKLSDIPGSELLIPACNKPRKLYFEARTLPDPAKNSTLLTVDMKEHGVSQGTINVNSSWQPIELEIPVSAKKVLPQVVSLHVAEASRTELRKINISACE